MRGDFEVDGGITELGIWSLMGAFSHCNVFCVILEGSSRIAMYGLE